MKLNSKRVQKIQELIVELESARDIKRTILFAGLLNANISSNTEADNLIPSFGKYADRLFLLDLWAKYEKNLNEVSGIDDALVQELRLNFSESMLLVEPDWALIGLKNLYNSSDLHRNQRISVFFFNNLYTTLLRPLHRLILTKGSTDQKNGILKTNEMIRFLGFSFYPIELLEMEDKAFDQAAHKEIRKEISRKVPHGAILSVHAMGVKYLDKVIMMPEVITAIHD